MASGVLLENVLPTHANLPIIRMMASRARVRRTSDGDRRSATARSGLYADEAVGDDQRGPGIRVRVVGRVEDHSAIEDRGRTAGLREDAAANIGGVELDNAARQRQLASEVAERAASTGGILLDGAAGQGQRPSRTVDGAA